MTDVLSNSTKFADFTPGSWDRELAKEPLKRPFEKPHLKGGTVIISRETFEITDPKIFGISISVPGVVRTLDQSINIILDSDVGGNWTPYGITQVDEEALEDDRATFVITNGTYKTDSPFSIIDESRDKDSKLEGQIAFIRESLNHPFGPELADRINYLFGFAKRDPEEDEMSPDSLKYFIYFIQSVPNLKYPDVILGPEGLIIAEWRVDKSRHFKVKFLEDEYIHFVLFAPNPRDFKKPRRFSGIVHFEELKDLMDKFNVNSWALRNVK